MKVILPNAMKCGCGYELFWHLNPVKLESFYEMYRMKVKEQVIMQDSFAWMQGAYIRDAILSVINRTAAYPKEPRGLNGDNDFYENQTESSGPQKGMSDGQNFALFMVKHNKALLEKKASRQHNA